MRESTLRMEGGCDGGEGPSIGPTALLCACSDSLPLNSGFFCLLTFSPYSLCVTAYGWYKPYSTQNCLCWVNLGHLVCVTLRLKFKDLAVTSLQFVL